MASTDEPFVKPTQIVSPSASIEVVKETYSPTASVDSVKASEQPAPVVQPTSPKPSVDIEKKGVDRDNIVFG